MNIEINKTNLFLIIIVIIFITVSLMGTYLRNDFKKNYIYTIATIDGVSIFGRSATNSINFKYYYNNDMKISSYSFPNDSTRYYKSQIGKRVLVKMSDKKWSYTLYSINKLYINKPVPDSIKEAPSEGWKELPVWAK